MKQQSLDTVYETSSIIAGSRATVVNLTPGGNSFEEWLNSLVSEGVKAKLEHISFDLTQQMLDERAACTLVVLVVSPSAPTMGSLDPGDNPTLEATLRAICGMYSFQLASTKGGPSIVTFDGTNVRCLHRHSGGMEIPQKWRALGVFESDEHLPAGGHRSYLLGILMSGDDLNAALTVSWRGYTHCRYNTENYETQFSSLLEGIE